MKDGGKEGREERSASSSICPHSVEKSYSTILAPKNEHFHTEMVWVE